MHPPQKHPIEGVSFSCIASSFGSLLGSLDGDSLTLATRGIVKSYHSLAENMDFPCRQLIFFDRKQKRE